MSQYHCFIAGLPEISFDDGKLSITMAEFKEAIEETLSTSDLELTNSFFRKYDNANLLSILEGKTTENNTLGTFDVAQLEEFILLSKEEENPNAPLLPSYFPPFIQSYIEEKPLFAGMLWQDQLSALYFSNYQQTKNKFVKDWFQFNLDVTNIVTAVQCRAFNIDLSTAIVGDSEVALAVKSSMAKDFGLSATFDFLEDVLRISEITNLLEREKRLDILKWNWIEENTTFEYFSIERVYAYLLQLDILERWSKLDSEVGQKVFSELVEKLVGSVDVKV